MTCKTNMRRRYYKLAKCKFYYADMLVEEITAEPSPALSSTIKQAFKPKEYDIQNRQAFAKDMIAMLKMYLTSLNPLFSNFNDYEVEDRDIFRHAVENIEAAIADIKLFAKI